MSQESVSEIQIFLVRFIANHRRMEPRNVGLIVRTAADELHIRFLGEDERTSFQPRGFDLREFADVVGKWRETFDKYGIKALKWVGKRKPGDTYYIEFAHGEMVSGFDFDKLFGELVL